jgi:putative restriction endonuclease
MPKVSFDHLRLNNAYSRQFLAESWGYKSYEAIARGVVTPADHHYIILFVTHEKQASAQQYRDRLEGERLFWEGPVDHFAEQRILDARNTRDEIHVFYRARHHSDFLYLGEAEVEKAKLASDTPSHFVFRLQSA